MTYTVHRKTHITVELDDMSVSINDKTLAEWHLFLSAKCVRCLKLDNGRVDPVITDDTYTFALMMAMRMYVWNYLLPDDIYYVARVVTWNLETNTVELKE